MTEEGQKTIENFRQEWQVRNDSMNSWDSERGGRPEIIDALRHNPLEVVNDWLDRFHIVPEAHDIQVVLEDANNSLIEQNKLNNGQLRGLNPDLPTIVVSDIHANVDYLRNIFNENIEIEGAYMPVLEAVRQGKVNLTFVGDIPHSEGEKEFMQNIYRNETRWLDRRSKVEIYKGKDIAYSTNAIIMMAALQAAFPGFVTVLRGNHEDIKATIDPMLRIPRTENNALIKEGVNMTQTTHEAMDDIYGRKISNMLKNLIEEYEDNLPLLAYCANTKNPFLVSHSAIGKSISRENLKAPNMETIVGLTWTDNTTDEYVNDRDKYSQWTQNTFNLAAELGLTNTFAVNILSFFGHRPLEPNTKYRRILGTTNNKLIFGYQIHQAKIGEHKYAIIPVNLVFNPDKNIKDANPKNKNLDSE